MHIIFGIQVKKKKEKYHILFMSDSANMIPIDLNKTPQQISDMYQCCQTVIFWFLTDEKLYICSLVMVIRSWHYLVNIHFVTSSLVSPRVPCMLPTHVHFNIFPTTHLSHVHDQPQGQGAPTPSHNVAKSIVLIIPEMEIEELTTEPEAWYYKDMETRPFVSS